MPGTVRSTAAMLALAALTAAPLAQAAENLVVTRDAESGQLRAATGAEVDAMKKSTTRAVAVTRTPSRVGGIETRFADGTVQRTLGDDDMMSMVAVRQADGTVKLECLPAAEAAKVVANPTAAKLSGHSHASHATKKLTAAQPQKDEAGRDLY